LKLKKNDVGFQKIFSLKSYLSIDFLKKVIFSEEKQKKAIENN